MNSATVMVKDGGTAGFGNADELRVATQAPAGAPAPLPDLQNLGKRREFAPGEEERLREQRAELHGRMTANLAPETEDAEPEEAVEAMDSIELELPNGHVIEYGPQRGRSKALVLGQIFSGPNASRMMDRNVVEYLLYIRSIDGRPSPAITNLVEAQKLLNLIDDDGLETLMVAHATYWPPITRERLRVLKKNLCRP